MYLFMKFVGQLLLILLLSFLPLTMSVFSVWWDSEPWVILSELKEPEIQNTKIDESWKSTGLKDSIKGLKEDVPWYIQWMTYIWLGLALLAIIYNGIILLTNLWDKSKLGVVKKRLISITVWVVFVVSAYLVLELVMSLIWNMIP